MFAALILLAITIFVNMVGAFVLNRASASQGGVQS